MAAGAETLKFTNAQELVEPLGIMLPDQIPDYSGKDSPEVKEEFESKIDTLLGAGDSGLTKGVMEADGASLVVVSSLDEIEHEEELATFVTGPSRSLSLSAPFNVEGLEGEDLKQFIQFDIPHSWMITFFGERRDDYSPMRISAGVDIPTAPMLRSFDLDYRHDDPHHKERNRKEWGSNSSSSQNLRAFGLGIAIVQAITPEDLEITRS